MRIAIVSDIHGNLTAFEAVLKDLRQTAPDLILHGGDLAQAGSSPAEIVDRIRDLGWPGVVGNTDELLFRPESLTEFASQLPQLQPLWAAIQETASWTCDALGAERIAWLSSLPRSQTHGPMTHACQSREPVAVTRPRRERRRVGFGLLAARPADRGLRAHSSLVCAERFANDGGEHRQRQSFVRRRSARGVSFAR